MNELSFIDVLNKIKIEDKEYKICSRCRIPLPVGEFNKNRSKKDGLQHNCKSCKAIIHTNTRDQVLQKQKEYRADNAESISEKKKVYYYKNRKDLLDKKAIYRLENKTKIATSDKLYKDKLKELKK